MKGLDSFSGTVKEAKKHLGMTTSEAGRRGGRISASKRFANMTKEQVSEFMRQVRKGGKTK